MIYTGIFQDTAGKFYFETHVASHDRRSAWHEVHDKRAIDDTCLIMLVDGKINVRTYQDIVDINIQ